VEIDASRVGEQVNSLFGKGYFCSKITAIILQDILGCPSDEVIKAMSSFSGGVGRNGTSCGALNGALAVVGQLFGCGREGKDDPRLVEYIQKVYNGFLKHAAKEYNSVNCRDIAGVDWWNPEEALSYFKSPEKINRCHRLIVDTIVQAANILKEAGAESK
jgi:C_GCAxxG_C_C family probable redox protein